MNGHRHNDPSRTSLHPKSNHETGSKTKRGDSLPLQGYLEISSRGTGEMCHDPMTPQNPIPL